MGQEFRDSAYLLSPKNSRQLKTNMIFNLSLGFQDLQSTDGKTWVHSCSWFLLGVLTCYPSRYALLLTDTVRIGQDKGVCLTDGVKSTKETLFYLTRDEDDDVEMVPSKKPAPKAANGHSPMKNKTAGGKVLRNKTRSAAQEEIVQTTAAKIAEHQKDLHRQLQTDGLAKYSEGGATGTGREGKTWKRFQSYKGEIALPREVESLRVR